ncbi:hypothetical protein ACFRNJ_46320, partial [Streptomyces sp. NPDC056721]
PRSATSPDSTYAARSSGSAASHEDLNSAQSLVQQLAPTYGMEPAQQAELIRDAEVLAEEASGETAQPGRIRAAFGAVMSGLAQIGAASAGLDLTIQHGQQALNTVFGS